MTDDWNEFRQLIKKDKSVEKCKQVKRVIKPIKSPIERPKIQDKIIPIHHLVRDIFIDDRRSVEGGILKRLSRGSHPIDISIDLHGYTVDKAYEVFYNTYLYATKSNLRLMLVITGKGDRNGYSIRSELMKWINIPEISSYIIYISEAHYKHGGDGAFYLILRRKF
jgi:DNA-nicking Smr family endonuclease